jgi:hypothetical protein
VNRFGVRLLPQLFEHFNPLRRWEAVELEPALAKALRYAGVSWVEGGHRWPWPPVARETQVLLVTRRSRF